MRPPPSPISAISPGRQHDLHRDRRSRACGRSARPAATSRRRRCGRRPASTGTRPGRRDRRRRARLSCSLSLSMLMPGPTVTVRSTRSISWIWFISLTSTRMPPRSGTAPSERPVPPARGTTGMPSRLASLTISETSCGGGREHGDVGHVVGPAVDRERRRDARAVDPRAEVGQDAVGVADDRAQLVEDRVVDRALERDAHGVASRAACVWPPTSMPADSATSSNRSITSSGGRRRRLRTAAAPTTGRR